METFSCGTSDVRTATSACSLLTLVRSSAVIGTLMTGKGNIYIFIGYVLRNNFWPDFHRGWLATGGRDKMVKVWDMTTNRAKEIFCVQTIASVARVKWRPERKFHLATCSMMVDHNIYVWDVRRPFIPFATFEEHKDVTTGIVWRHQHDPHFLLSGSKDSTLYQHMFKDATRPVDKANPEALCFGLFGDLAFAAKESLISSDVNRKPYPGGDRRYPIFFFKKPDPTEQFAHVSSAFSVFETDLDSNRMDWFVKTAQLYLLTGKPFAELCDHNAKVAQDLKRPQVRSPPGPQNRTFIPEHS